jgi:hypothetical protein
MNKHKRAGIVLLVLVLASFFSAWAIAGDLEPSADPAPTMHSLEDIYNLIANIGTAPVEKSGQTSSYATGDDGDKEEGIAWPDSRFSDNGDGTVTDNLTGLIWLQNADRNGGTMNWADALVYCNSLADDGSALTDGSVAGDWRLPNVKELQSLIDFGNYNPALPTGHPFSNVQSSYYWSSTTNANNTDNAWNVNMNNGNVNNNNKTNNNYVWPVRGDN